MGNKGSRLLLVAVAISSFGLLNLFASEVDEAHSDAFRICDKDLKFLIEQRIAFGETIIDRLRNAAEHVSLADSKAVKLRRIEDRYQNPKRVAAMSEAFQLPIAVGSLPYHHTKTTGDFYGVFRSPEGKMAIFVGDFTGHGPLSAKGVVFLHRMIQQDSVQKLFDRASPSDILRGLDRIRLKKESDIHGIEVNLAHLIIDPRSETLSYADAGFPGIFVRHENGGMELLRTTDAPGIVFDGTHRNIRSYSASDQESETYHLQPNDLVFLLTDGLWDGVSKKTGHRLMDFLLQIPPAASKRKSHPTRAEKRFFAAFQRMSSPSRVVDFLLNQLHGFRDDATVLAFQWPGKKLQADREPEKASLAQAKSKVEKHLAFTTHVRSSP